MMFDKRIWKTGVLAAAITLVAALFVMRLDDWSKGLTSGFIAYGQSGTGGTGSTGTSSSCGSGAACITKTLPDVVAGSGYSSVIEIINTSTVTESITASFFNTDGSTSTATYSMTVGGGTSSTFTGSTSLSLPANQILVLSLPNTESTINWGNITSTSTITVAEVFELRDANNNLISRVGVPASAPNMTKFVIPRFRNTLTNMDVGFAVVNTGSSDATLTVTLTDATGNVLGTKTLTLPEHTQLATFPTGQSGLFPNLQPPADLSGYGALTFVASGPQLAAIGLADEFQTKSLATFPVDQIQ